MVDLIARETHLDKLNAILQKAIQGRLQIVFVTGEAGVGKTALVTIFTEQIKRQTPELFVAGGKCTSIAGGRQEAYLPFVQILEAVSSAKKDNTTWDRLRRGMAEIAPEWIQILPGGGIVAAVMRTAQWGQSEFGDRGEGADLSRLMVQYTNALRLIAETMPLLLWIDDLHWSDNATLDLLSFMADQARDSRIMLVATYRPTDVAHEVRGQPHPVRQLASKLERYGQCIEVALSNFTRADVEQFLVARSYSFPEVFVERLWRQSGGNPLFVREYVKLLHERRLVTRKRGVFTLAQTDAEVDIPATAQAVIKQRLALIGHDLKRLLSYASVQGERFASRTLAQLLESPELDVLEKLNLLERMHQLIREMEARQLIVKVGAEYQFVHVLTQQVLYNDLSAGQRRQLHLAIAQLLEGLYGEDAGRYAVDLATHFERGGDMVKAIRYYLQASRNALEVLAFDDALSYAEAVRQLAGQLGEGKQTTGWHLEALIQIAEAYIWKAEYELALTACEEGTTLCQQGDFAEQLAHLLYWCARTLYLMGIRGESVGATKQALEILGDAPSNRVLQGYLYTHLGILHHLLPLSEVQQALDAAQAIAEEQGFPDVEARALTRKAWVAMNVTDTPEDALHFAQRALAIAQSHKMVYEQINCHRLIAYAYRRMGRGEEAFSHSQQAVTIARQSGLPRALYIALGTLAVCWRGVRGEWRKSLSIMREAIAVAEQYHFLGSGSVIGSWFDTALGSGLWREAEQANARYREYINPSYPRAWGSYYRQRGHLASARGLFEDAVEFYELSMAAFDEHSPSERPSRLVQPSLGLALIAVDEVQRGIKNLEEAADYWRNRYPYYFAMSLLGLARADLTRGDSVRAIARLREALVLAERSYDTDHWPSSPQIHTDLGQALLTAGETDEALEHALAGYNKFKKIGHFLLGEAAFVVGQILVAQGKHDEALAYLHEARDDWQRLELVHHMPAWEAFMQKHSLT